MARLRACQSQEQREAARETARLAMRNRRGNLRDRARRDYSRIDFNRAAFRYDFKIDYRSHASVCIGPMNVVCEYFGALKYSGEMPGLCCLGSETVNFDSTT